VAAPPAMANAATQTMASTVIATTAARMSTV
jgi:hypothetical protein